MTAFSLAFKEAFGTVRKGGWIKGCVWRIAPNWQLIKLTPSLWRTVLPKHWWVSGCFWVTAVANENVSHHVGHSRQWTETCRQGFSQHNYPSSLLLTTQLVQLNFAHTIIYQALNRPVFHTCASHMLFLPPGTPFCSSLSLWTILKDTNQRSPILGSPSIFTQCRAGGPSTVCPGCVSSSCCNNLLLIIFVAELSLGTQVNKCIILTSKS